MTEARHSSIVRTAWDPDFCTRSAIFEPLRAHAQCLPRTRWPAPGDLQRLLSSAPPVLVHSGLPLTAVAQPVRFPLGYEARAYERGELQVRAENWHDLFNALVWRMCPRAKAAVNQAHYAASRASEPARRGPRRDALTLFDESGIVVASADAVLLQALRGFRWHELFWDRRVRVREAMRFVVFGHALYEKALCPYIGLTGHALLITVDDGFVKLAPGEQIRKLDGLIAAELEDERGLSSPRALAPLPVLGVPGWWADNEHEAFYRNARYFRPGRRTTGMPKEKTP